MIPEEFTIRIKPALIMNVFFLSPILVFPIFILGYILSLTEQPSNWVQAVGSVLALVGAAVLPIWHFDRAKKQKELETLQLMSALAIREMQMLKMLLECFRTDGKTG